MSCVKQLRSCVRRYTPLSPECSCFPFNFSCRSLLDTSFSHFLSQGPFRVPPPTLRVTLSPKLPNHTKVPLREIADPRQKADHTYNVFSSHVGFRPYSKCPTQHFDVFIPFAQQIRAPSSEPRLPSSPCYNLQRGDSKCERDGPSRRLT